MKTQENLSTLVELFFKKDEVATTILFKKYKKDILFYNFKYLKDAELSKDILVETWIKAQRAESHFKIGSNFRAWILTIARNLCLDLLRKNKIIPTLVPIEYTVGEDIHIVPIIDNEPNPEEQEVRTENNDYTRSLIRAAIQELPQEQKDVIFLYYYEEFTFAEIAEMLGVNINTVLGRARYAKKTIQKYIEDQEKP